MDATGLRALSAITSSSLLFLHSCSRAFPLLRRPFFLVKSKPNSFHLSTTRFSLRCSPSERCRADALPNGVGAAVSEVPSNKEFFHVVLVSPQIPGNTGCIARTCAASAVKLHLIEPLGFQVDDAKLKRAGLDYWPYVVVKVHSSWSEFREYFMKQDGEKRLLAFTKRGTNIHSEFSYRRGDWLVFGSETSGLPSEALLDCKGEPLGGGTIRIPMVETYVRCLNLSVSVGIALYEASRQLNYEPFHGASEHCMNRETTFLTEDIFA
ncbi:tRNA (cytidine(34)-2'-O)-methyltransferase [Handroanthus impetiginosus]|uniref:tRNA (Cytidine(34)-2'-O)-methyltransferase n=1 Tax=Handroanthus impetiginosus TaxID=429701 RepID=A0A2G9HAQ8_9LAMI|nr:tRNA (cytidine(34)-2'-O)-methyltransferase [Handroanthus impetiginosus]